MYEIGLCQFFNSPAIEKRGPYQTREEACEACRKANEKKPDPPRNHWRWWWARLNEIPLQEKK